MRPNDKARFDAKWCRNESGCWLWNARIHPNGYGAFGFGDVVYKAHRAAWMIYRGAIPTGMCVLHRCDVPRCVNPDHLFLGTQIDNVRDMVQKKRHWSHGTTHCKHGHALGGNHYVKRLPNGRTARICKTCHKT